MLRKGDKVRCVDPGGQKGLVQDKIYTVTRDENRDGMVWVDRGYDTECYASRFIALPKGNYVLIKACLETLRDTTNSRMVHADCSKALEELDKLTG